MTVTADQPQEANSSSSVGRRTFLAGAGAGALTLATAKAAKAAGAPTVPTGTSTVPIPTSAELHFIRRWTYGYTPDTYDAVQQAGGLSQWFSRQLNPGTIPDPAGDALDSWWASINQTPDSIVKRENDKVERAWVALQNYARWTLQKRIQSSRQVLELMTEFWEHHLYIPRDDDGVYPFRIDYGKQIRNLALSSFEEILQMATVHPAMGCSLDNSTSQKRAVNENLGRELLELHTVGQGNYTEADVRNSALVLTGWRVKMWNTWEVLYEPSWHYVGPVKVMGWSHANSSSDGRAATMSYLSYLARHPATARRIVKKLCLRFVSDSPSEALISSLAKVYLDNNTQIKPVLLALVASDEFKNAKQTKLRTPTDDQVSTLRILRPTFSKPVSDASGANTILWSTQTMGGTPFSWPRPDGPPDKNEAWNSAGRFLGSFDVHFTQAGGWYPTQQIAWRKPMDYFPPGVSSITFRDLVEHMSRTLFGEKSTSTFLQACSEAVAIKPEAVITSSHSLVKWQWASLLLVFLDSPSNFLR